MTNVHRTRVCRAKTFFFIYFVVPKARIKIIELEVVKLFVSLLKHPASEIIINVLAALIQLDIDSTVSAQINGTDLQNSLTAHKQSTNNTIKNLATILSEKLP